jgi:His-Xaa-Ser system protein HxsD
MNRVNLTPAREASVVFDAASHPVDAIQRAAYKYGAHFSIEVQREGENLLCVLHFHGDEIDLDVVADFRAEVLDQVLRSRIRQETEGVRNLILAWAFSEAVGDDG